MEQNEPFWKIFFFSTYFHHYRIHISRSLWKTQNKVHTVFAVSVLSQHMYFSKEAHLEVDYKILKILMYLKGLPNKCLFFKKNENNGVKVFTHMDWVDLVEDIRFSTLYLERAKRKSW